MAEPAVNIPNDQENFIAQFLALQQEVQFLNQQLQGLAQQQPAAAATAGPDAPVAGVAAQPVPIIPVVQPQAAIPAVAPAHQVQQA